MEESFLLTAECLPLIIDKIKDFMRSGNKKDSDIHTIAQSFESALKKWLEKFDGVKTEIYFEKKFHSYQIELILPETEAFDPFEEETQDGNEHYSEVYRDLSESYAYVIYTYHNGGNALVYAFKKNTNSSVPMVISFAAAILFGLLLRFVFPDFGSLLATEIMDPICSKFISMLTMIASPMMFFLLVTTICKLGTRRELTDLGKKLIGGIWLTLILLTILTTLLCGAVYGFNVAAEASQGEASGQFAAIRDLFLNIIPSSIVEPFVTGNALQIVFLALVIGVTVFIRKTQNNTLIKLNSQIDTTFQSIMTAINSIMPVYIFLSLTSMITTVDFTELFNLWKLIVLFFVMIIAYYIILILRIAFVAKQPILKVIKAIAPAYLTALMTASSLAAFNKSLSCSRDSFGIPDKQAKFYMSTGRTVYKAASTCNYILIACFFAYLSGTVNMTLSWYVMVFITCLILGVATPPIPGGAKTCYTILFLQLGIPIAWLALVIGIDTLFDFFCTASDVAGLQVNLLTINERSKRKAVKTKE